MSSTAALDALLLVKELSLEELKELGELCREAKNDRLLELWKRAIAEIHLQRDRAASTRIMFDSNRWR